MSTYILSTKMLANTDTRTIMTHTVQQKSAMEEQETDIVLPVFNPSDSIFRKLANKESFSPDEVYKVVTAIEKKEASKKMIETFTANLQKMAEEAKLKDDIKRSEAPAKSGKNAYEIRSDVMALAVQFAIAKNNDCPNSYKEDDVIVLAKKFYAFVENRR